MFKHLFGLAVVTATFLSIASAPALCATISASDASRFITVKGAIRPGDDERLGRLIGNVPKRERPYVLLQSEGGDLDAALAMGRRLRARDSIVSVKGPCLSSCVLVAVGGVTRLDLVEEGKDKSQIGVHRFYFTDLAASTSSAEVSRRRQEARAKIANYFREMNIASQLLDLMEAVPPESMRMLTAQEVEVLGLSAPDPVFDEMEVASEAAYRNITSAEYRRRRAKVDVACAKFLSLARAIDYFRCEEATLWGVAMRDYQRADARFTRWYEEVKSRYDYEVPESKISAIRRCKREMLIEGRTSCPLP
jgi:hypothetical protein